MSRVAYVNGRYVPHRAAAVHVEDRGYQFADGVYEVFAVAGGCLVDEDRHLDRLDRSLVELRIPAPMARPALQAVLREVLRRNKILNGMVYLQVTRGVAPRDHAFPDTSQPALVVTARRAKPRDPDQATKGVKVITVDDIRWRRCDIKSVSLLPNVLAKQQALEAGAYDAWQVNAEGYITEGSASNAWIITANNELITHQPDAAILRGVTRTAVQELAAAEGLKLVERPFTVAEAKAAAEAFLTSTTSRVLAVTQIDETRLSGGIAGPMTQKLLALYCEIEARGGAGGRK